MRIRRRAQSGTSVANTLASRFQPGKWLEALSRGHEWRPFILAFVAALVIGYLLAAVALFPAPLFTERLTVPDFIGFTANEAQEAIASAGLALGEVESSNHPTAEPGQVVWQDPPRGMVVPQGTSVDLSVSQGAQLVPIPDVANYTSEIAALLVRSAGLVPVMDSVQTASPRGVVINTRPATGTTLRPGSTVRVLVSVGSPTITVPDLSGLTLEQARDTLQALGLIMGEFPQATSRTQPPGTIFRQEPSAGTLKAPGSRITGWIVRTGPRQ